MSFRASRAPYARLRREIDEIVTEVRDRAGSPTLLLLLQVSRDAVTEVRERCSQLQGGVLLTEYPR